MGTQRLHGDERELTIMARDAHGQVVHPKLLVDRMMEELGALPSVASSKESKGLFLAHGHVYAELESLLEAACADCRTPVGATLQGALLRTVIAEAGTRVREALSLSQLVISQHNTAYNLEDIDHSTAGHFNIGRSVPVHTLMPDLCTFMSVLPLLSGGGGLDLRTFDFTMSLRAMRCTAMTSGHTSTRRGIVDTKEIPAPHGSRQHLLGIDNLQSHLQTRAVYAAVHLLVQCLETHPEGAPRIELAQPVTDLHCAVAGANLAHFYRLADGRRMTGVQLLLTYCDWIRERKKDTPLPQWADEELENVSEIATKLNDGGLVALEGLCDHATLWKLWNRTLDAHDIPLKSARAARRALVRKGNAQAIWQKIVANERTPGPCPSSDVVGVTRWRRPDSDVLDRYILAMRKFMAIAYEYGDIMRGGLFHQLTDSGLAAPGVLFTDSQLDGQCHQPPPEEEGRCHIRANAILDLARNGEEAQANWEEVRSLRRGVLDLRAPGPSGSFEWGPIPQRQLKSKDDRHPFTSLRAYLVERNSLASIRAVEYTPLGVEGSHP
ncbi:MAG: hypothetical protein AMXMBFR84_35140 [Candidatus Hydrogenedentota bacterium]